ncbi:MAG: hypothetical protein AB8G18_16010 [Gammaproteobacteria bacterium]
MKRLLTALLAASLLTLPVAADGWKFEAGYQRTAASDSGSDLNFGSIYGIVDYEWDHNNDYVSAAEVLVSVGVQDDELFGVDVELSNTVAVGYRGTWQTGAEDVQLFWRANYTQLAVDVAEGGTTLDDSGVGVGVGLNWKHLTIGYTKYLGDLEDFDSINIGFKFGR